MTEHVIELLQIPLRVVGNAFDGLADGRFESYALLGTAIGALALAAYLRKDKAQSGFEQAVLPEGAAPGAAWEGKANEAALRALDSSKTDAASAVLAARTPGGGE